MDVCFDKGWTRLCTNKVVTCTQALGGQHIGTNAGPAQSGIEGRSPYQNHNPKSESGIASPVCCLFLSFSLYSCLFNFSSGTSAVQWEHSIIIVIGSDLIKTPCCVPLPSPPLATRFSPTYRRTDERGFLSLHLFGHSSSHPSSSRALLQALVLTESLGNAATLTKSNKPRPPCVSFAKPSELEM